MDTTKENTLLQQGADTFANTPKFYPTFSNAGQLQENGYQPIPIRPNQKSPSIDDWPNYKFSEDDPDRLGFQRHGIGILTARTPAIDIDCYCPIIAELLKQMVIRVLGCCEAPPPMRIGQKPKLLFVCQTKNPFRKKATKKYKLPRYEAYKDSGVEILADGQQFVAYGIHPDTDAPYSWNGSGDPLNVPVGLLPEITEEQTEEIIRQAELIYELNGGIPSDSTKPNAGSVAPPIVLPLETIAELRSALLFMRADDYAPWMDIAHALATLGDVGRGLWLEWGATAYQQWNAGEASKKWDSIKLGQNPDGTSRTSYKAVFKKAQALGWTNPLKKDKAAAGGHNMTDKNRIVALDFNDILTMHFPPMEAMLGPWLCRQHLSLIHAWRGVGKTHFALGVAYAVASGGEYLKWTANKPYRVVYIDGEMSGASIQARLEAIVKIADKHPAQGYLQIITPDAQSLPIPDLATTEGQAALAPRIADAELIVVDNLSCLMRTGEENKAEGWHSTAEWALDLRRQGKTVLFVAHDGKNGERRGTSKVEDILDCVLHLTHEADYDPEKGAAFTCSFVKARHLTGKDAADIEAALSNDTGKWTWREAALEMADRIRKLKAEAPDMRQKEIAEELGCSHATVSRALKQQGF